MYLHTAILHTAHCTALLGSAWIAPRAGRHAGSFFTGPWKLNFAPAIAHLVGPLGRSAVARSSLPPRSLGATATASSMLRSPLDILPPPLPNHFRTLRCTGLHLRRSHINPPTHLHIHTHTHTHAPTSPADTPDLTHSRRSMWPP